MSARGFLAALAFASLAVTACTPGVQPLLDEYNALFGKVTLANQGDAYLKENGWLDDHYKVPKGTTLNLYAPLHCESYEWKLEAVEGAGSKLPDNFDIANYGGKGQHLAINLDKANFETGYFIITCTVVLNGKTIVDRANVNVVD